MSDGLADYVIAVARAGISTDGPTVEELFPDGWPDDEARGLVRALAIEAEGVKVTLDCAQADLHQLGFSREGRSIEEQIEEMETELKRLRKSDPAAKKKLQFGDVHIVSLTQARELLDVREPLDEADADDRQKGPWTFALGPYGSWPEKLSDAETVFETETHWRLCQSLRLGPVVIYKAGWGYSASEDMVALFLETLAKG